MSQEPLRTFDLWADDVAHGDPQRVLIALGRVMRFLDEKLHSAGESHPSLVPELLLVNATDEVDLEHLEGSEVSRGAGFLSYRAPELTDLTPLTPQAEVYAIAAIAYRAFSGHAPLRGNRRMMCPWQSDLSLNIPKQPELSKAVLAALSLDVSKRPQDLRALHSSLFQAYLPLAVSRYPKVEKRFPVNLTVGKDVRVPFSKVVGSAEGWNVKWRGLEAVGITLDDEKTEFVCAPTVAGEHRIVADFSHPDRPHHPIFSDATLITINPDPDSLWKNIEPPADAPFQKTNTACERLDTPDARVFAASQRGRSHAHEGSFREDDYRVSYHEASGWHLLVAADGAGSAKMSRRGSELACETSRNELTKWLEEGAAKLEEAIVPLVKEGESGKIKQQLYLWLVTAAHSSLKAIKEEAASMDPPCPAKDFHTTLLICAAKKVDEGWVLVSFTIGDGGVGIRQGDGSPIAFCEPDSGEFSGQTVFLTVPDVFKDADKNMSRLHAAFVKDLGAVVLMTDGITDPRFPTEASLKDKACWDAFWSEVSGVAQFEQAGAHERLLKWLSFKSAGNHDDRTVVFLLPALPKVPEAPNA